MESKNLTVYPAALENEAMSSGLLKECVVVDRKSGDPLEGNVPVMYAVLTEDTEEERRGFEKFCNRNFRETSSLYQIIYMDELPKTGAGKKAFKYLKEYDAKTFPAAKGTEQASCYISKTDLLYGEGQREPLQQA